MAADRPIVRRTGHIGWNLQMQGAIVRKLIVQHYRLCINMKQIKNILLLLARWLNRPVGWAPYDENAAVGQS